MSSKYITINRKKYAVGLVWQPIGAGYVARTYARVLARSVGGKLNLYTEYRAMVGLATRGGARIGMHAAAAEIMDTLTEYNSFLGVFTVGNLFYLVAVRNGIILVDKLFDNAADARAEYAELLEIPDWNALFAPGAWGMPRAIERNISDMISGNARAVLRPISRFTGGVYSIVLLVLFGLILLRLFGEPIGQIFSSRPQVGQIDPELAAEYKRQVEEKNKELDAQFDIKKDTPPPPLVMPYDNLPNPMVRAESCYQAIGFLMQPVSGWVQTVVECGETHASVQFRRTFGTLGGFYSIVDGLMPGVFVQPQNENVVSARATLPTLAHNASLDERDLDTLDRDVKTAFQSAGMPISAIEMVVDTITNGVDVANLNILEISAESKLTPMQFMKIFEDFGGVYMTRCAWDANLRTWNYEVIIYAK